MFSRKVKQGEVIKYRNRPSPWSYFKGLIMGVMVTSLAFMSFLAYTPYIQPIYQLAKKNDVEFARDIEPVKPVELKTTKGMKLSDAREIKDIYGH